MNAITTQPMPPHLWVAAFLADPDGQLDALLRGLASVFPYTRTDPPDAALALFGGGDPEDSVLEVLDAAMLRWLVARKAQTPPRGPALQRWVRETSDALAIVALLGLRASAYDLRVRFVVWNDWAARYVLSTARDLRLRYWRTLGLTQPLLAETAPDIDGEALAPFWRSVCEESGGRLPAHYLAVGLLGLRRLPLKDGPSDTAWVTGLAYWALKQHPAEAAFKREWFGLKALYPRTPARWRKIVGEVLAAEPFRKAEIEAPEWFACDPIFQSMAGPKFRSTSQPVTGPGKHECDLLIEEFGKGFDQLEPRIDTLLQASRRQAAVLSDPFALVHNIHQLGTALLRTEADDKAARRRKAEALARDGLGWDPNNLYLWGLLSDAFLAQGDPQGAELVTWEAILRRPDSPNAAAQLATLLGRQPDRRPEAEALLQAFIRKFPNNPFLRNELAELLIFEDRSDDARTVVDRALMEAANDATYALSARLFDDSGQHDAARAALAEGLRKHPSKVLQGLNRTLEQGKRLKLKSSLFSEAPVTDPDRSPTEDPFIAAAMQRGRLRRLRFVAENLEGAIRDKAERELLDLAEADRTSAYATVVLARYGRGDEEALPSFAVAFERALAAGDLEKLEHLARMQPKLTALILVAQAVLGDQDAAQRLEAWLRQPPPANENQFIGILRGQLQPLPADALHPAGKGGAARARLVEIAHDTNELITLDWLAAA